MEIWEKNDSPKELLQSENKNVSRDDFKNTHNNIDTHNVTWVAIQDHNRIRCTKLYYIFAYYGKCETIILKILAYSIIIVQ